MSYTGRVAEAYLCKRGERVKKMYKKNEIEQFVSQMMIDMGIPVHLKGYHYMRSAVVMAVQDMKVVGSVTKLLYPEIARQYGTTNGKVERAIRNAIEISWERGNKEEMEEDKIVFHIWLPGTWSEDGHTVIGRN